MAVNTRKAEALTLVQRLRESLGAGDSSNQPKKPSGNSIPVPNYGNRSVHLRQGRLRGGESDDPFGSAKGRRSRGEDGDGSDSAGSRSGGQDDIEYKTTQVLDMESVPTGQRSIIQDTMNGRWRPNFGLGLGMGVNSREDVCDKLEDLDSLKPPPHDIGTGSHKSQQQSMYQTLMSFNSTGNKGFENDKLVGRFCPVPPPSAPSLDLDDWRPGTQQSLLTGKISTLSAASFDSKLTINDDTHALCGDHSKSIEQHKPSGVCRAKVAIPWFILGLLVGFLLMFIIAKSTWKQTDCDGDSIALAASQTSNNTKRDPQLSDSCTTYESSERTKFEKIASRCKSELATCKKMTGFTSEDETVETSAASRRGRELDSGIDDPFLSSEPLDYDISFGNATNNTTSPNVPENLIRVSPRDLTTEIPSSVDAVPTTTENEGSFRSETFPTPTAHAQSTSTLAKADGWTEDDPVSSLVTQSSFTNDSFGDPIPTVPSSESSLEHKSTESVGPMSTESMELNTRAETSFSDNTITAGGASFKHTSDIADPDEGVSRTTLSMTDEMETSTASPEVSFGSDSSQSPPITTTERHEHEYRSTETLDQDATNGSSLTTGAASTPSELTTIAATESIHTGFSSDRISTTNTQMFASPTTPESAISSIGRSQGADAEVPEESTPSPTATKPTVHTFEGGYSDQVTSTQVGYRGSTTIPSRTTPRTPVTMGTTHNVYSETSPKPSENPAVGEQVTNETTAPPRSPEYTAIDADVLQNTSPPPAQTTASDGVTQRGLITSNFSTPGKIPTEDLKKAGNYEHGGPETTSKPKDREAAKSLDSYITKSTTSTWKPPMGPAVQGGGSGAGSSASNGAKRRKQKGWFQRFLEVVREVINSVTPFQVKSRDDGNLDIKVQ